MEDAMSFQRSSPFSVRMFGYLILGAGVLSTAADFYSRIELSFPLNMGIAIGNTVFVLLGLVAIAVAQCLQTLEDRLDKIERRKPLLRRPEISDG
jgi:hypothetical protein